MADKEIVSMINKSGCLMCVLLVILVLVVDWIVSLGLVWLISWCFGWSFSWKVATGVWMVVLLLHGVFKIKIEK
jgi:hypothetical protein